MADLCLMEATGTTSKEELSSRQTVQQHCLRFIYLRSTRCYQEGIGPSWVIIVMHGCSHIKSHQLQGRDVASQASVAVICRCVCLRKHITHMAVSDSTVRI